MANGEQQDHRVGLAPHELAERDERVELLTGHFLAIANRTHTPGSLEYMQGGGNLRLCLTEIMALSGPCDQDQQVSAVRTEYMDMAFRRRGFIHRGARKRIFRGMEERYVDTVVDKIAAVVDAETPEDALTLGQMPTLVEKASFGDGVLSPDDLAANHLYILIDTALKEHVHRRHAVARHVRKGPVAKVATSRAVHMAIAGAVFAASVSPRLGLLPTHGEYTAESIEDGLKVLSGTVLGLSAPEAVRLRYLQITHDRRSGELQDQLAEDRGLTDHALRMTYNSTRYGNPDGTGIVTGRSGTDDKAENLKRFALLDHDFPHLNNDPGGKPYTGEQALGYAARLLVEREDQVREITRLDKTPEERRELFLALCKEILFEDVIRMKKGLNVSRARRGVVNMFAAVPAILFPQAASVANDASTLGRDTAEALASESETQ